MKIHLPALSTNPARIWKIAAAALALLVVWMLWYQDTQDSIAYLEHQLALANKSSVNLQKLKDLSKELATNKTAYSAILDGYSAGGSKELFLQTFEKARQQLETGRIQSIASDGEQKNSDGFFVEAVEMELAGSYSQLKIFIDDLQKAPVLFGLEEWQFENTEIHHGDPLIEASLRIKLLSSFDPQ